MNDNSKVSRNIPEDIKRAVLLEAGHRCAICKQTPVEFAHIVPWEKVREHTIENIIALCPNCHDRYDKKKEIDRQAMLQYKANLSNINRRAGVPEKEINNLADRGSYLLIDQRAIDPFYAEIMNKVF